MMEHLLSVNATVVLTARKQEQGQQLKKQLQEAFPNSNIHVLELDVSNPNSVLALVANLQTQGIVVNHIIHNAGVYNVPAVVTNDGWEIHLATNYLGAMLLTLKLLPMLNQTSCSRVVFQSSMSANYYPINWQELPNMQTWKNIRIYSATKRLTNLTVLGLNKQMQNKHPNVTLVLAHPGVCATNIISYKSKAFTSVANGVLKRACHSPQTAALGVITGLFVKPQQGMWLAPRGLGQVWGKPTQKSLPKNYTQSEQQNAVTYLKQMLTPYLNDTEVWF